MTEEQHRRKLEYNRQYRKDHPLSEAEKARRRKKAKEYYEEKKKKRGTPKGVARHPEADAEKKRKKKEQPADVIVRENAEARALGISYGRYQMLKQQGRLPENIPLPENPPTQKLGVYVPPERGLSEFNASRERMFAVAAAKIMEEKREKRTRVKAMDSIDSNYAERMKKQKEAVERARVSTAD